MMITYSKYKSKTANWWIGRLVSLDRQIRTHYHIYPKGMIFTIEEKYGGLRLTRTSTCPGCKVGTIFKLTTSPSNLTLIKKAGNDV